MTAFPQNADGAASMSASLTSPITPFTQSALPSKSLLSRESTATAFDPALPNGGPHGGSHGPSSAQRTMQHRLQAVIEQLFEKCFREGRYRQVIGIAIEARNLDVLKGVIRRAAEDEKKSEARSEDSPRKSDELMEYVLDICMTVVQERALRNAVRNPSDTSKVRSLTCLRYVDSQVDPGSIDRATQTRLFRHRQVRCLSE